MGTRLIGGMTIGQADERYPRVDSPNQGLTPTEQANARGNIRAADYANNTFVLFGDSRTQYNDTITATQHFKNAAGSFNLGNSLSGNRAIVLKQSGIGGNTTTQMLARIDDDVLAYRPAWCAVWAGINDITSGSISIAQTIQNLGDIYDILEANGIGILAYTETQAAAVGALTVGQKQAVFTLNNWINRQALTRSRFYVVDACAATIDPASSPAIMQPDACRDNLGAAVHIGALGGYLVGKKVAAILNVILPPTDGLLSSAYDQYGASSISNNILDGGLFLSGGGVAGTGVSGTVAALWRAQRQAGAGSCTASLVSRSDGIGNNQRFAITGANATDVWQFNMDTTATPTARVVTGGVYVAECEIAISSPVNFNTARLRTLFTVGGVPYEFADVYPNQSSESGIGINSDCVYRCSTPPFTVPAGAITVGTGQVYITFSGPSASVTVDVGRMSMRRVA